MRNPQETTRIEVLLFPQFSNHCLANAVEPLRAANGYARRPLFHWRFVSLGGGRLTSSSGLRVDTEGLSRDATGDMLFLLPSYGFRDADTPATRSAIRAAARRFGIVAGFDTGAWLMATARLLDGRQATIHWDEYAAFTETFPSVHVRPDRFVIDGSRITCGGAEAAFDLALHLIQAWHGAALRMNVGALFLHGAPPSPDSALPRTRRARVDRAIALMRSALEHPLPIRAVARALGVSQRSLEVEFARHLGLPPRAAYRLLRLEEARRLIEGSTLSVAEVALRCGWDTPGALTRAFRERYGVPPRVMRAGTAG